MIQCCQDCYNAKNQYSIMGELRYEYITCLAMNRSVKRFSIDVKCPLHPPRRSDRQKGVNHETTL